MFPQVAAAAVELSHALRRPAARLLRGIGRQRMQLRALSEAWRPGVAGPLLRDGGSPAEPGRDAEREEGQSAAPHGRPRSASLGAPGSPSAFGSPTGGGRRCLMAVWQRPHSMFLPATWKSWMKAVSA